MTCQDAVVVGKPFVLWLGYKVPSLNRLIGCNKWTFVAVKSGAQTALRLSLAARNIRWNTTYTKSPQPTRRTLTPKQ